MPWLKESPSSVVEHAAMQQMKRQCKVQVEVIPNPHVSWEALTLDSCFLFVFFLLQILSAAKVEFCPETINESKWAFREKTVCPWSLWKKSQSEGGLCWGALCLRKPCDIPILRHIECWLSNTFELKNNEAVEGSGQRALLQTNSALLWCGCLFAQILTTSCRTTPPIPISERMAKSSHQFETLQHSAGLLQ